MATGVPPGPLGLADSLSSTQDSPQAFRTCTLPGPLGLDPESSLHAPQCFQRDGHESSTEASAAESAQTSIDVDLAIQKIKAIAQPNYTGKCAMHVRMALEAGGADMRTRPVYAKDYGPKLLDIGFRLIPHQGYVPQRGDVVVFQDYPGQRVAAGHIQMFDGTRWISDTAQGNFLANQRHYRDIPYAIYRP